MRAHTVLIAFLLTAMGAAANPQAPDKLSDPSLDALFAKLGKAQSTDAAKPIETEILTRFLQSGSPSVDLLMTHAAGLIQVGDGDTAGKIFNAVTNIAPAYAEGWRQRAKIEADAGKDEAAMASLQKAVTLNPREFEAQVELGDMLAEYGAKSAALAAYRKALALDPHLEGLDRRVQQLARDVEGEKI